MMDIVKNDIITLKNNNLEKEYIIAEILEFNKKKYLYLIETNENNEILDKHQIVEYIEEKSEIKEVDDINLFNELKELFIPMLEQDYADE